MAKLSTDLRTAVLHPRENLSATGTISALNSEIIADCDGCSSFTLDMRGTFNLFLEVSGTVDGTNWQPIVLRLLNAASKLYQTQAGGTFTGVYFGQCAGFRRIRARCVVYTSGSSVTTLMASNAPPFFGLEELVTGNLGTTVGASGAATTLTLASPGVGMRHYLTYLSVNRFAAAALTAAAAPVTVTTTNLPGTLAFSFAADAALQGTLDRWREDFAYPLAASAQNTATTIVCPATTSVIWRITAGFYVAP
jgi:hypothetical protein